MLTTTTRIYNFSAGPAMLPLPVLEQAQRDLISLPGVGMSVMEISHRSKTFEDLLNTAIADIRALAGIPAARTTVCLPLHLLRDGVGPKRGRSTHEQS